MWGVPRRVEGRIVTLSPVQRREFEKALERELRPERVWPWILWTFVFGMVLFLLALDARLYELRHIPALLRGPVLILLSLALGLGWPLAKLHTYIGRAKGKKRLSDLPPAAPPTPISEDERLVCEVCGKTCVYSRQHQQIECPDGHPWGVAS